MIVPRRLWELVWEILFSKPLKSVTKPWYKVSGTPPMSTHRGILASSLSCLCWAPMEAVEFFVTRKKYEQVIYIYIIYIILYMYTVYYITMFLMTCDEYEFVVLNSVYVSRSPSADTLSMSIQRSHNFGLAITSFGGELAIKTCPPKLIFIHLFRKPSVFF